MKKHLLILSGVLLVFILGTSTVAANIALPPNEPGIKPYGKNIAPPQQTPYEQFLGECYRIHQLRLKDCDEHYATINPRHKKCVQQSLESLQQCYALARELYINPPPTLELPNSKSPGQGNGQPMQQNFKLEIDGVIMAGFKEVSGIESETEIIEIKDRNDMAIGREIEGISDIVEGIMDTIDFKDGDDASEKIITLKRGFINDPALREWYEETVEGKTDRKSGAVILTGHDEERIYDFFDALPVRWKWQTHSKDGKAKDGEGLRFIEELELAVGGVALREETDFIIPAGDSQFKVIDAGFNVQLPADFFGPGSEPFEGTITCQGEPGSIDTVIERKSDIILPPPPSEDTIPIEIIELNLVSCQPISVNNNDGSQQQWDVQVSLPPNLPPLVPFPLGVMTIKRMHEDGGTFDSELPVQPRFIFTRVGDSQDELEEFRRKIIDFDKSKGQGDAILPRLFKAFDVPWQTCPNANPELGFGFCPGSIQFFSDDSWLNLEPVVPALPDDGGDSSCDANTDDLELATDDIKRADVNSDSVIDAKDTELLALALKSVCPDADADDVIDGIDNCPLTANPDQSDLDADSLGDACDVCPNDTDNDADGDGMCGDVDNCPLENPQGLDADSDGCTDNYRKPL